MKFNTLTSAFLTATMLTTVAHATIYQKDFNEQGVWNAYNSDTDVYSMKYTTDGTKDGFSLIVSDGPSPQNGTSEYAILYGDTKNNVITAYAFDGGNGSTSFESGRYLGTFENAFSDGGQIKGEDTLMFALNVSEINAALDNPEWDGIQIGEQSGIWFNQSAGSNFQYDENGEIQGYSSSAQMLLDRKDVDSLVRPEGFCDDGLRPNNFACKGGNGSPLASPEFTGGNSGVGTNPGGTNGGWTAPTSSTGGTSTTSTSGGGGSVPVPAGLAFIFVAAAFFGLRRYAS